MTDKCNNCSQNIDTSGCTANKYYLVNPTVDNQEAIYCESCWPQIESEYRLKNYQGKAYIHVWEHAVRGSGKNYMLGYNWNTKQWVEVDLTTRKNDLGSPPNDNNPTERERERANFSITKSDCWIRGYC